MGRKLHTHGKAENTSSSIRNRMRRIEVSRSFKMGKKKDKRQARLERRREVEALGEDAPERPAPKTLDTMREVDETIVEPGDAEVGLDMGQDEFKGYFAGEVNPKILLTTSAKPSGQLYTIVREILDTIPASEYYARKGYALKDICNYGIARGYTDVMVLEEDRPRRKWRNVIISHLPDGPTAKFRVSSVVLGKDIRGHGRKQLFKPEIVLNGFVTRLGQTIGRMLGSLAPQDPTFTGRSVITFHNQRDYIFFRHHRYVFHDKDSVGLQELGPQFTLKLQSLQRGTYDTVGGEYMWRHKPDMDTSRRRFFL